MSDTHLDKLRADIVRALNLTPLVPPQADTETLNIVNDAWTALSELAAHAREMEATALAELLRELEAERDLWQERAEDAWNRRDRLQEFVGKFSAAEIRLAARVEELEGEAGIWQESSGAYRERMVAAEARVEELEAALREISEAQFIGEASNIARAALAPPGEGASE